MTNKRERGIPTTAQLPPLLRAKLEVLARDEAVTYGKFLTDLITISLSVPALQPRIQQCAAEQAAKDRQRGKYSPTSPAAKVLAAMSAGKNGVSASSPGPILVSAQPIATAAGATAEPHDTTLGKPGGDVREDGALVGPPTVDPDSEPTDEELNEAFPPTEKE